MQAKGCHFIGIQKDLREGDKELMSTLTNLTWVGDQLSDFSDTAALMSMCDWSFPPTPLSCIWPARWHGPRGYCWSISQIGVGSSKARTIRGIRPRAYSGSQAHGDWIQLSRR